VPGVLFWDLWAPQTSDSVMLTSPFTSQVRDLQRPLAIKSCWR